MKAGIIFCAKKQHLLAAAGRKRRAVKAPALKAHQIKCTRNGSKEEEMKPALSFFLSRARPWD